MRKEASLEQWKVLYEVATNSHKGIKIVGKVLEHGFDWH